MAELTFRILSGSDRGRIITRQTPVTIGRESGNSLQLNDLLVSRCHLKIQEDNGVVLLADCDSTNGTRVNGEPVRQWILRPGDLVTLGGTTFLVGSRAEIESRLAVEPSEEDPLAGVGGDSSERLRRDDDQFFTDFLGAQSRYRALFQNRIPELPDTFSPLQAAQMSELFQYLYLKIRKFREWAIHERMVQGISVSDEPELRVNERGGAASDRKRAAADAGNRKGDEGAAISAVVAAAGDHFNSPESPKSLNPPGSARDRIAPQQWQNILDMESLLVSCLRKLEQPDET